MRQHLLQVRWQNMFGGTHAYVMQQLGNCCLSCLETPPLVLEMRSASSIFSRCSQYANRLAERSPTQFHGDFSSCIRTIRRQLRSARAVFACLEQLLSL